MCKKFSFTNKFSNGNMNTTFTAAVKAQSLNCTTFFEKNYKPIFRLARGYKKILKKSPKKII